MNKHDEQIKNFCKQVKADYGKLSDMKVKKMFETFSESKVQPSLFGRILAIMEKNELLDKETSVNKEPGFYQKMYIHLQEAVTRNHKILGTKENWERKIKDSNKSEKTKQIAMGIIRDVFKHPEHMASDSQKVILVEIETGIRPSYSTKN